MVSDRRLQIRTPLANVITRSIYNSVKTFTRDFYEADLLINGDQDPASTIERSVDRIQDALVTHLQAARPRFGFRIFEEADTIGQDHEQFWVINPLSGRHNFARGIAHVALSVAVQLKDEILASAVYDPIHDEMFYAERGQGAFMNERRLHMSKTSQSKHALTALTHRNDAVMQAQPSDVSISLSHCPALDLCYTAAGRYDAVWVDEQTDSTDCAAGFLILKEANAKIVSNEEITHYSQTKYFAGNKNIDSFIESI